MQTKATFLTLIMLLVSISGFSMADSLSLSILQKSLDKHKSLDSIQFHYTYTIQVMDQDFNWKSYKAVEGTCKVNAPDLKVLELQYGEVLESDQFLYFDALSTIQIALNNKKIKLSCGCSPLPYYVIELSNISYKGLNSNNHSAYRTVYIDTVTYLIHAMTSVSNLDSGKVELKTFTMDSVKTYIKQPAVKTTIFQLNRNMLKPGDNAPDFTLKDSDGKTINLSDYQGKLVLLDFWYAACKPCIKASFHLEALQKKYANRGLVVLGMNTMDKADKIRRHNKKHKVTYNSVLCPRSIKEIYKIRSYPSFYLIDQNGVIVFSTSGYYAGLEKDLELAILQAFSNR